MSVFEKDSLKRKTDIFLPRLVAQTALVYFSREATYQTFVRWTAPSRKAVEASGSFHWAVDIEFFDVSICASFYEQKPLAPPGIFQVDLQ
ncbi:hypothetical protein T10_7862 [Trichinella papuae]|uniref:Uncharacterized protein n=1 Tax=Trichinella papuae TaxID=268474 RepID=A0A0V1MFI9_9BILA|nr:hypothetical protein T10_7862 [Trichinella papuae]